MERPTPRNLPSKNQNNPTAERSALLDMSNAAAGFVESAVRQQREEEGDGLQQALQDDLSSRKAFETDPAATHQDYPSSERAMEEGHVYGADRAEHDHENTESMMQKGYSDGVSMAQHGESKVEKIPKEDFDDELHRAQDGYSSSDQELQENYGGGLHRAQPWDLSWEQSMHSGAEAETKVSHEFAPSITSKSPQPEKVTNAQSPHNSFVRANLTDIGAFSEQGKLGAQENLAACRTSSKHHPENVPSAQNSDDDADQNIGAQGRPMEYSSAAYMAPFGISGEHTHKNGFTNGTVGEHVHGNTSTCGTPNQHPGGNVDLYTEGDQPGKYPHKSMSGNGSAGGDHAPGYACDDSFRHGDFWGNVYDHTSRNNESDADAHEKVVANEKTGGDFKIVLSQDASSMQAPTFAKSPIKAGSPIAGSSYYKTQSAAMKITELALRFGSAVFSLIAFSVIISTNEKRVAAGSTFYVKFSDYQAYNYLVAINLLSFLYSGGQLVLLAQAKSNNILSSPLKLGILLYLCDQILAILMVSCSSSAATASELSRHGLRNIWPPACSTWQLSLFCSKADVAVSISFISFLFMLLSSFSSGYHLSKLLAE